MTYPVTISSHAHPTGRQVVELSGSGPKNVTQLANHLPVSRPTVSQHLKYLKIFSDADLLAAKVIGTRRIYRLKPVRANDLRDCMDRLWGDTLSSFNWHIEKEADSD
jgi:DNA-binding transcriptional ArsR family regulator